jgi:hypothetical protein
VGPTAVLDAVGEKKALASARNRIPTFPPVARRYTGWAILFRNAVMKGI